MAYKVLFAAGILLATTAAQATVVDSFVGSTTPLGLQAGETLVADFDTTTGGGVFSGQGQSNHTTGVYSTSISGVAAAPAGDSTKYLAVLSGGSASFTFATSSSVAFDVGSVDDFNKVTVTLTGAGAPQSFTGSQINKPNAATGNQTIAQTNGRVTITGTAGELFTGITFTSSGNSFEVDNIGRVSAPMPEAATWAMFICGFGMIGSALRRRKTAISFA